MVKNLEIGKFPINFQRFLSYICLLEKNLSFRKNGGKSQFQQNSQVFLKYLKVLCGCYAIEL